MRQSYSSTQGLSTDKDTFIKGASTNGDTRNMSKSDGNRTFHAPERVVERGRGCWNCIHFENKNLAKQHYADRMQQEKTAAAAQGIGGLTRLGDDDASIRDVAHKAAEFMQQGHSMEHATNMALEVVGASSISTQQALQNARQAELRFRVFDTASQHGAIGICMKGGSGTDFVHHAYLCDKWTGSEGHRIAAEGHAPDKLPEELVEEIDGKAKKA
jgi:hypothetical protein